MAAGSPRRSAWTSDMGGLYRWWTGARVKAALTGLWASCATRTQESSTASHDAWDSRQHCPDRARAMNAELFEQHRIGELAVNAQMAPRDVEHPRRNLFRYCAR